MKLTQLAFSMAAFGIGGFIACQSRGYNQAVATEARGAGGFPITQEKERVAQAVRQITYFTEGMAGLVSVTTGNCEEFWASDVLGQAHIQPLIVPKFGVIMTFEKADQLKNFASASQVFGSTHTIPMDQFAKSFGDVVVCGALKK